MSSDNDNRRAGGAPARVSVGEIAALLAELPVISEPGTPLTRIITFQERKIDIFRRMAADEPDNTTRALLVEQAESYLAFLQIARARGMTRRVFGGFA